MGAFVEGHWDESAVDPNPEGGSNLSSEQRAAQDSGGGSSSAGGAPAPAPTSGGGSGSTAGMYQTPNGLKSYDQMLAEVRQAGWEYPQSQMSNNSAAFNQQIVARAYATATNGIVEPASAPPVTYAGPNGQLYQVVGPQAAPVAQQAQPTGNQQSIEAALAQLIAGDEAIKKAIAEGNMDALREAVRQFDLSFGLDQNKFAQAVSEFNQNFGLLQGGLTGTYQGQPTLAAQKQASDLALAAAGLTGTYQGQPTMQAQLQNAQLYGSNAAPSPGQQTLGAQQQYFTQGLQGMTLAAGLQANPFRQQQVLGQLGPLLGGGAVAGFQAPNTVAGVGTQGGNTQGGLGYMQQMIDDIKNPTANQTNVNQVLDAIPTPNKLNSVDFLRASPSTQQMILQGMSEKYGIDPADAQRQVMNTLPQFQAPTTMGTIRR